MAPLQFSFVPTADDYIRSTRAFHLRQTSTRLLLGVASLLFAWALYSQFRYGFQPLGLASLLFLPFFLLFLFVIPAITLRRRFQTTEQMRHETTWTVDDETILVRQPGLESRMVWSTFRRVVEVPGFYLLVLSSSPNMIQILPRRAFASPEQDAQFREVARRHLPG